MNPRQVVAEALHDQMCRAAMAGEECKANRHSGAGYAHASRKLIADLADAGYEITRTTP